MTYSEKLKDPRWQKRRLEILQRDGFQCQFGYGNCPPETELHIHHRRYIRGKDPWDYHESDLVTVCADCHKSITNLKERIGRVLHHDVEWTAFNHLMGFFGDFPPPHGIAIGIILARLHDEPKLIESVLEIVSPGSLSWWNSPAPEEEEEAVK